MKTQVAHTSIRCYREIKQEGGLNRQQSAIAAAMRKGFDYSLQELCLVTGLQVNAVSSRVNEMKASGALVVAKKRPCRVTGRMVNTVKLASKQLGLI